MRYVAAYLLAVLGGKASPLTSDIEKILTSVGVEIDPENLKLVLECLKGKSIDDLIAEGMLVFDTKFIVLSTEILLTNFP